MKTWDKMSDAEQGAMLLAHYRGGKIEIWDDVDGAWLRCVSPTWVDGCTYRVKKEPVVEVLVETISILGDLYMHHYRATCTYTDGKLTKIHWEAE